MREDQLRRRLLDDGMTEEEAEAELDNLASDWYDNQKDEDSNESNRF